MLAKLTVFLIKRNMGCPNKNAQETKLQIGLAKSYQLEVESVSFAEL